MDAKHKLDQYFTTAAELQAKVVSFILRQPVRILEPSVGRGHLVAATCAVHPNIKFDMYEIDRSVKPLAGLPGNIIWGDFMAQSIEYKYDTIIGNPPYVRTRAGNLYIDFIEKCFGLLAPQGELIFIVPADFFKLTSAARVLTAMHNEGVFTHVYHPHNERLFEGAHIDIIVFRYCRDPTAPKQTLYNDDLMTTDHSAGLITFSALGDNTNEANLFSEYFNIYVGLVSGRESVYRNATYGNIDVICGDNLVERYIFLSKFPSDNEGLNEYMLSHKADLMARRIRKFGEHNWFEWGAPRNLDAVVAAAGRPCIYVYNLTRRPRVAFAGTVGYFGGGLLMLVPKRECSLERIVEYLNSSAFKKNFIFSGRFKIGHRQICNSTIPAEYL